MDFSSSEREYTDLEKCLMMVMLWVVGAPLCEMHPHPHIAHGFVFCNEGHPHLACRPCGEGYVEAAKRTLAQEHQRRAEWN